MVVQIRHATIDDMPALLDMGEKFYATTHYAAIVPYCRKAVAGLVDLMLLGVLLVAERDDGALVGMVGLVLAPFPFNANVKTAHEIMWWVDPSAQNSGTGKALLEAIEPACRERGARMIQMMHLADSPPAAAILYQRYGYRWSEMSFTKEL